MTTKIVISPADYASAIEYVAGCWNHAGFITRRELGDPEPVEIIDADHLARQAAWSETTFGPGTRMTGVLDHIRKELDEIEADGDGVKSDEWFDVVILALDGAWRAGWTPQEIVDAIVAKQTKNEGRVWPDWRTADPTKAIEHDRSVA